jgi:hypothetical protein
MSLATRPPGDTGPYPRHPDSRPYGPDIPAGDYVYVQAADGVVWVLPETDSHLRVRVLGGGTPVAAAGGLRVGLDGVIVELENISDSFRFGPDVLPQVRAALERQGGTLTPDAENPFDW